MKQFAGYEKAKEEAQNRASFPKLPVGAYVLKVQGARVDAGTDGYNDKLVVAFDIDEGEQKDYFKKKFEADTSENKKWKGTFSITIPSDNDGEDKSWIARKFAEYMNMFEDSNKGFVWKWNEADLKGKKIGGVFSEVQKAIDGKNVTWVTCRWFESVENVKNGLVQIPEKKIYSSVEESTSVDDAGFMEIKKDEVQDLPF